MPFGIQPIHLIIIAIVALLIFGPRRLPEMGRGIGRAINEFRKGAQEMTETLRDEVVKPPSGETTAAPSAGQPQPPAPLQAPSTAAGKFCTQCGAPNPADGRFCGKCGAQLPA